MSSILIAPSHKIHQKYYFQVLQWAPHTYQCDNVHCKYCHIMDLKFLECFGRVMLYELKVSSHIHTRQKSHFKYICFSSTLRIYFHHNHHCSCCVTHKWLVTELKDRHCSKTKLTQDYSHSSCVMWSKIISCTTTLFQVVMVQSETINFTISNYLYIYAKRNTTHTRLLGLITGKMCTDNWENTYNMIFLFTAKWIFFFMYCTIVFENTIGLCQTFNTFNCRF